MKSLAVLSSVSAAVLVLLQLGGGTSAEPLPLPILPGLPLPLSSQPSAKPAAPAAAYPQQGSYYPYPYLPQQPGEFEGLSSKSSTSGTGNIDFTGFDILGNLNLPANVLSLTDLLS